MLTWQAVPKQSSTSYNKRFERPGSAEERAALLPEITLTVREVRPVHLLWKQIQTEYTRYVDECAAAAEFFQHSSRVMKTHLKNSLLQVGVTLAKLGCHHITCTIVYCS